MKKNITEGNLTDFLETKLQVEGRVTLNNFIESVSRAFDLTDYDKQKSKTRPNEMLYEQRCRNINCHKSFPSDRIDYTDCVFSLKK